MNCVVMIGRLTRSPECKQAQTGTTVCKFSIAVNRPYKKDGQPEADFFNCTAFGKTGETIGLYMTKGRQIGIRGSLQNYSYEDQQGNKRTSTSIIVDQFDFVGSKNYGENKKPVDTSLHGMEIDEDFSLIAEDDDIPF